MSNLGIKNITHLANGLYKVKITKNKLSYTKHFKTLEEAIADKEKYLASNPYLQKEIPQKSDGRKNAKIFPRDMILFRQLFVNSDYLLENRSGGVFDCGDMFLHNNIPDDRQLVWMITKDPSAVCLYYWNLLKDNHIRQLQDKVQAGKLDVEYLQHVDNKRRFFK